MRLRTSGRRRPCGGVADSKMEISGICYDSRTLQPGSSLWLCRAAVLTGHRFIWEAVEAGLPCGCVSTRRRGGTWIPRCPTPARPPGRTSSANWFGAPGPGATVIGVTGTTARLPTTYLPQGSSGGGAGARVGLISQPEYAIGGESPARPAQRRRVERSRSSCGMA